MVWNTCINNNVHTFKINNKLMKNMRNNKMIFNNVLEFLNGLDQTKMKIDFGTFSKEGISINIDLSILLDKEQPLSYMCYEALKGATLDSYPDITLDGPTEDRVIYGRDSLYYPESGSIQDAIDILIRISNDNSLDIKSIREVRDYAIQGGYEYGNEKRINKFSHFNMYLYLMDPFCWKSLSKDIELNTPIICNPNRDIKGYFQIDNILVVACPALKMFQQKNTNGDSIIAWNMLIGAQAFSPILEQVSDNRFKVNGLNVMKYPSLKYKDILVENGIIHHFVPI